jgi:hypothetical protein
MRPRTRALTALVALSASSTLLTSCGLGGGGEEQSSTDVQPVADTTAEAGSVQVVLPAGAASGGQLSLETGPEPTLVPAGVEALGPTTAVTLEDASLTGAMEVSFDPPAELAADDVPVVMAREGSGDWAWLPTSWKGGDERVTAELAGPGQVFLARFDSGPSVDDAVEELTAKTTNPSKAPDPDCGDPQRAIDRGVETSSEDGESLVKWCAGVDTIDSNPATSGYDLDSAVDGVQAMVLRVTNNSRMFEEIGYPEEWPAVDGSGHALSGQELRSRLAFAGTIRDGLASRVLAPAQTLNLLLPSAEATGTVTADLSAAAWTLSALDFASSTYTRLVTGVDEQLGDQVRASRESLIGAIADGSGLSFGAAPQEAESGGIVEPEDTDEPAPVEVPTVSDEELSKLRDCLAPLASTILMYPDVAEQLVAQAAACAPAALRPVLSEQFGSGPAEMADSVASSVLAALPTALQDDTAPWAQITDARTDPSAGFQIWVGPPPSE